MIYKHINRFYFDKFIQLFSIDPAGKNTSNYVLGARNSLKLFKVKNGEKLIRLKPIEVHFFTFKNMKFRKK